MFFRSVPWQEHRWAFKQLFEGRNQFFAGDIPILVKDLFCHDDLIRALDDITSVDNQVGLEGWDAQFTQCSARVGYVIFVLGGRQVVRCILVLHKLGAADLNRHIISAPIVLGVVEKAIFNAIPA